MAVTFVFKSSMFPPEAGEDAETNPGLFGKALSGWLAKQLTSLGYTVEREVPEDFGRLVELRYPRFQSYVACCSTDDSALEWRVFGFMEGGSAREGDPFLQKLDANLEAILRNEPGIAELKKDSE